MQRQICQDLQDSTKQKISSHHERRARNFVSTKKKRETCVAVQRRHHATGGNTVHDLLDRTQTQQQQAEGSLFHCSIPFTRPCPPLKLLISPSLHFQLSTVRNTNTNLKSIVQIPVHRANVSVLSSAKTVSHTSVVSRYLKQKCKGYMVSKETGQQLWLKIRSVPTVVFQIQNYSPSSFRCHHRALSITDAEFPSVLASVTAESCVKCLHAGRS